VGDHYDEIMQGYDDALRHLKAAERSLIWIGRICIAGAVFIVLMMLAAVTLMMFT
jgi:hypothetical protein